MAVRPYAADAENTFGSTLRLITDDDRGWRLVFEPSREALHQYEQTSGEPLAEGPYTLIQGGDEEAPLITHPMNTNATSPYFLQPKHDDLKTITFEGFRIVPPLDVDEVMGIGEAFPPACIRNPLFGLGLARDFRHIAAAVAQSGVSDLTIVGGFGEFDPSIKGDSYRLPVELLDNTRRAINAIHTRALKVADDEKRVRTNNDLLTRIDAERFPEMSPKYRKDAIVERLGRRPVVGDNISNADADALMHMAHATVRKVAKRKSKELLKLQNEIELVSLEQLIERFKKLLDNNNAKEAEWQNFLTANPFILHLAFGYPIAIVGEQISVGGRGFQRIGEKVADIAVKALSSGNMALIEIKTPQTPLLEKKAYRGGVYAASAQLHGGVSQVLDQRYKLTTNMPTLQHNSRQWDVESYAIQCLVIAGRGPDGDDRKKSFELYRHSLKSVSVVTYDEMLAKLEALLAFLLETTADKAVANGDEETRKP